MAADTVATSLRQPSGQTKSLPGHVAAHALAQPRFADTDVLATFAHELRAPLATMQATLEVLGDLPGPHHEEAPDMLRRLERSVAWLDSLVSNINTWAVVDGRAAICQRSQQSVLTWTEAAISLVQPLLERRGQRVNLCCPDPAPVAYGDSQRLTQILVNLLTNAGAYSHPGDVIDVVVAAEGEETVQVRVSDHGPGIAPDERDRIFDRYVRGSRAGSNHFGGLGLGLSIVKTLVEGHGGSLGVTSEPGQGASFWFTIPASSAKTAETFA